MAKQFHAWMLKNIAGDEDRKVMPEWHRLHLDRWINLNGQRHAWKPDDYIHSSIVVEHDAEKELLWMIVSTLKRDFPQQFKLMQGLARKRMCSRSNSSGWVAPSGEWFPCGHQNHDKFCLYFFGELPEDIEHTHARVGHEFWSIQGGLVTSGIKTTLIRMGFVQDGELYHRRDMED